MKYQVDAKKPEFFDSLKKARETFKHTFEDYKWKEMQETSHRKFQKKFGGKVFTVFSVKEGKKKVIYNPEVIEQIIKEMRRLEER